MSTIAQQLVYGLNLGSLLALYALGVGLMFGIMRLLNFAQAALITAGGYTLVLTSGLPLILRLVLCVAVCVTLAILVDLLVFRFARGTDPGSLLIISFALTVVATSAAEAAFGSLGRSTTLTPAFSASWDVLGMTVKVGSVINIAVTVVLLVALTCFLRYTEAGLQMRAAAEDFTTSRLLGVRANRVIRTGFAISGVLAAATAVLLIGNKELVTPDFGINPLLFGFIAAVLGGLSSLKGAVVGGYVLGMLSQVLQVALPLEIRPFRDAILFVAVFAMLVVRPNGLVGSRQGVRV